MSSTSLLLPFHTSFPSFLLSLPLTSSFLSFFLNPSSLTSFSFFNPFAVPSSLNYCQFSFTPSRLQSFFFFLSLVYAFLPPPLFPSMQLSSFPSVTLYPHCLFFSPASLLPPFLFLFGLYFSSSYLISFHAITLTLAFHLTSTPSSSSSIPLSSPTFLLPSLCFSPSFTLPRAVQGVEEVRTGSGRGQERVKRSKQIHFLMLPALIRQRHGQKRGTKCRFS